MEGKIYKAMAEAMADVRAVTKDEINRQQGFKFRSIDAVYNAIQPALTKHNIFIAPEVLEQTREERQTKSGGNLIYTILKVKYTFFTDDGSSVPVVVHGEGMDSADKSTNKAMAAAFKYACFQTFCIPTEELQDPDADSHEIKPKSKQQSKPNQQPQQQQPQPTGFADSAPIPTVAEVRKALKDNKVDENYTCKLYSVPSLDVMNDKQRANLIDNIDKLVAKYKQNMGGQK